MSLRARADIPITRLLFLAANPDSTAPLHAGREVRRIRERLAGTADGHALEIHERWAVRPSDLQQALIELKPQIVHFSGHGSVECELMLEGEHGVPHPVGKRVLAELFRLRGASVRLVVLSACHSLPQAEAIAEHVDFAIGMQRAIGSEAAMELSAALYHALASGDSIRRAFESAQLHLAAVGIPEHRTPQIVVRRDGVDVDQTLVRGPSPGTEPIQTPQHKSSPVGVRGALGSPQDAFETETSAYRPGASIGEYQLGKLLARGKSTEVWAGVHKRSGREVAIKILARDYRMTPDGLRRFSREVKIALSIKHPNICEYLDCGKTDGSGTYFLVMERLSGETLSARLGTLGPLTLAELRQPVEQVLLALEAIHTQGVIHRDIRPGTIFLERQSSPPHERVKIIGFGMAKVIHISQSAYTMTQLTSNGATVVGGSVYAPPEMLGKNAFADYGSDLYSLGTVIFRALSGRLPYDGRNQLLLLKAKITEKAMSLEECTGVSWPPALERLLARLLERDQEKRIQSAAEALEAWNAIPAASEPCFERRR